MVWWNGTRVHLFSILIMKKYLIHLIVFVGIFIAADRVFGYILAINRPTDYATFLASKKTYFENPQSYDILVIGDSHVADAVDPEIVENKTGKIVYNLGVYHSSPLENYYLTLAAIENQGSLPEILILGTNPVMFERPLSKGKYTPLILPKSKSKLGLLINSIDGFDASFFLKSAQEKYLIKSVAKKMVGIKYQPTREIENVYNGYSRFNNQLPDVEWNDFPNQKESNLDCRQVEYFIKTLRLALDLNIKVVLVHSPIWKTEFEHLKQSASYKDFDIHINEIDYNLEIPQFEYNPTLTPMLQEDYLNTQHLNHKGSTKFSKQLGEYLNTL